MFVFLSFSSLSFFSLLFGTCWLLSKSNLYIHLKKTVFSRCSWLFWLKISGKTSSLLFSLFASGLCREELWDLKRFGSYFSLHNDLLTYVLAGKSSGWVWIWEPDIIGYFSKTCFVYKMALCRKSYDSNNVLLGIFHDDFFWIFSR